MENVKNRRVRRIALFPVQAISNRMRWQMVLLGRMAIAMVWQKWPNSRHKGRKAHSVRT
jgi:hypothetical protein